MHYDLQNYNTIRFSLNKKPEILNFKGFGFSYDNFQTMASEQNYHTLGILLYMYQILRNLCTHCLGG